MAKGNMLLGMARKKVGDLVFYRANGEQISRARNRAPRNPRSAKQAVQRMVLATASKMAAAWRPIVDHSFEGYEVGQVSVRHFQQLAMARLRGQAAYVINGGEVEDSRADFAIKGAPIVGISEGLRLSSGILSFGQISAKGDGEFGLAVGDGSLLTATITTQAGYEAALATMGLEPGDQLTFVCVEMNTDQAVASYGYENNYAQRVRYARVVFKPTIPESFSGTFIYNGAFNSSLIERTEGTYPTMRVEDNELVIISPTGDWSRIQAGFIRSQIDVNGKWRYSTCDLISNFGDLDWNNANLVYQSYMDNTESIEVGDNLYLRNAVATPLGN